jgi:uncharacterized protein (TIGR02611 family)
MKPHQFNEPPRNGQLGEQFERASKRLSTLSQIKRVAIAVVGGTVLALGIALVVLPGPAFIVIPAGLAILAIEFAWARRWLRSARAILQWRSKDDSVPAERLTIQSVRRSGKFLLRQVRRTLLPKRKAT